VISFPKVKSHEGFESDTRTRGWSVSVVVAARWETRNAELSVAPPVALAACSP